MANDPAMTKKQLAKNLYNSPLRSCRVNAIMGVFGKWLTMFTLRLGLRFEPSNICLFILTSEGYLALQVFVPTI